jgi:hypothetical protein
VPQLAILALVGAGLYAGYRWYARTAKAVTAEIKRAEDELRVRAAGAIEKDLGTLVFDPVSGMYRPSKRD